MVVESVVEEPHPKEVEPDDKLSESKKVVEPNEPVPVVKRAIESIAMPQHASNVETTTPMPDDHDNDGDEEEEADDEDDDDDDDDDEEESTREDEEYDDFDVFDGHALQHPVEEFLTEAEKEQRRQALALEQQQRFLAHVQAARATRQQQQQRLVEDSKPDPQQQQQQQRKLKFGELDLDEDDTAKQERLEHQKKRPERTKGVLFRRLANGSLVRVDRSGEPLPRKTFKREDASVEEVPSANHTKPTVPEVPPPKKEFVPAPVPKVSAWKLGTLDCLSLWCILC
jgi:hypothetical protein